jgi:hypothetical protein
VGGEQRAEQQRSGQRPAHRQADQGPKQHRQGEADQPERHQGPAMHANQRQIELNAGDEHQVQEPQLPELGNRRVPGPDRVQAVRTDREPTDDQADDPRAPRHPHQRRPKDDHQEQQQELPRGTGRRLDRERS